MVSAFSVPKAKRQESLSRNPGPGQYNPETSPKIVKPSDPNYSFGKQGRKQQRINVPGPGSYDSKEMFIKQKNPSYSLGSRRNQYGDKLNVGPGAYDPKLEQAKGRSPAYSYDFLYGRSKDNFKGNKVGPGEYQIKGQIEKNKSGYHFSKDNRDSFGANKVPGPGSYEYQNAVFKYGSKQEPSYGFGSRIKDSTGLSVPGPGSYEKKDSFSRIGGIMSRQMRNHISDSKTPGPGNYDHDGNKVKSRDPSWSLPKSSRDWMYKSAVVGPGAYEHDKNFKNLSTINRGYNFGSDKKLKYDINNVPGPGNYDGDNIKSRKNIKISQKLKDPSGSYVPGPGSYQNQKYDYQSWMKGSGRYSLGRSSRDGLDNNKVPGPGSYDRYNLDNHHGKVTFGKDSRLKQLKSGVPGPGQYDLKPYFADVPKYLLPDKA